MFFKTSHCFKAKDIFFNIKLDGLKFSKNQYSKYGVNNRRCFFGQIFTYCIYLIFLDIIENNVTFVLPLLNSAEACFYVKSSSGESFRESYQRGKYKGIDFLSSNFTGYQIYYEYTTKAGIKEKPVYISRELKDRFYENINNGKTYYPKEITKVEKYYAQILEQFPELNVKQVDRILKHGFRSFYSLNAKGADVTLVSKGLKILFGYAFFDSRVFYVYWLGKMQIKLKILYYRHRTPYSGYYYIGLRESEFQDFMKQFKTRKMKKCAVFKNVQCHGILEECLIDYRYKHIFRFAFPQHVGLNFSKEKLATKNYQYIYRRKEDNTLEPINNE